MTYEKITQFEPLFDKWHIENKIAEGKNSTIFKASAYENGKRDCKAVEVIKIPGSNEEISRALDSERFNTVDEYMEFAEKTICENIEKMLTFSESKNIVNYKDYTVIRESNCFYVIILRELMVPLSEYIKENRIKQKEAVKLGWDLCNALEEFRNAGIIHRNIKPENIFVGKNSAFKLGDFGIDGLYRKKSGLGSYRAPEAGTEREVSADIYALGIVLYRLLNNNRAPFLPEYPAPVSLEDRERAATRRLRGDLFPMPANADSTLARIIFTATAFRPEERYTSPDEMKTDLEEYVKNIIIAPPQPKTTYVGTHYVPSAPQKHQRSDGAASVTGKDKAAFAEVFRDDDTVEEKSYKKWYILIGVLAVILAVMVGIIISSLSGKDNTTDGSDIVFSPSYYDSTTEPSTKPVTDDESTTTEETTEDTTEDITDESTTQQETTEPETTEEATTEEATTEPETTQSEETTEEVTTTQHVQGTVTPPPPKPGDLDSSGREYYELTDCRVVFVPQSDSENTIVIELNNLKGSNPTAGTAPYICIEYEGTIILRSGLEMSFIEAEQGSYLCELTVADESFFYIPEDYAYYIVLTAGSIVTDTAANTETRLDF